MCCLCICLPCCRAAERAQAIKEEASPLRQAPSPALSSPALTPQQLSMLNGQAGASNKSRTSVHSSALSEGQQQHEGPSSVVSARSSMAGPLSDARLVTNSAAGSEVPGSAGPSSWIGAPSMSAVRAFLQGQQHQSAGASAAGEEGSSSRDSSGAFAAVPQPPATAASGVASNISRISTDQPAAARSQLLQEASLASSPAARVAAPSELELQRWNVASAADPLQRVFQRSDTRWTDTEYEAPADLDLVGTVDDDGTGGLPEDLVREASAAGAAAAAARTGSSSSAAATVPAAARPPATDS